MYEAGSACHAKRRRSKGRGPFVHRQLTLNILVGVLIDHEDRHGYDARLLVVANISQERLTLLPDGRLHYTMKKTFRDGLRAGV